MHGASQYGLGRGSDGTPVSLGENFENVGFGGFSETRTILFGRGLAGYGERLNSLQARTDGGCTVFDGFHRAEYDQR